MCGAACPSADAVHILVAFRGVLCKVDPCSKHPPDVSVPLIKPFMNDGVDEWWTWWWGEKGNWSSLCKKLKIGITFSEKESDMEKKGSFVAWTFPNCISDRSFISWQVPWKSMRSLWWLWFSSAISFCLCAYRSLSFLFTTFWICTNIQSAHTESTNIHTIN